MPTWSITLRKDLAIFRAVGNLWHSLLRPSRLSGGVSAAACLRRPPHAAAPRLPLPVLLRSFRPDRVHHFWSCSVAQLPSLPISVGAWRSSPPDPESYLSPVTPLGAARVSARTRTGVAGCGLQVPAHGHLRHRSLEGDSKREWRQVRLLSLGRYGDSLGRW